MWRLLLVILCIMVLPACSTIAGMFTAPEATAAGVATAGAETLTGAPVSQVIGTGDSIASLERALAENPDAANREELLALRNHMREQAEARSRMQAGDHVPSRIYDRRNPFDPRPRALIAERDADGNLISYRALDRYQGLEVDAEQPGPFDWYSRSRDSWRFTQPRRYQLGRHVLPGIRERLVPLGGNSVIAPIQIRPEGIEAIDDRRH